jgi:hypothetical protein
MARPACAVGIFEPTCAYEVVCVVLPEWFNSGGHVTLVFFWILQVNLYDPVTFRHKSLLWWLSVPLSGFPLTGASGEATLDAKAILENVRVQRCAAFGASVQRAVRPLQQDAP